jgi:hypothetical protein
MKLDDDRITDVAIDPGPSGIERQRIGGDEEGRYAPQLILIRLPLNVVIVFLTRQKF